MTARLLKINVGTFARKEWTCHVPYVPLLSGPGHIDGSPTLLSCEWGVGGAGLALGVGVATGLLTSPWDIPDLGAC